MSTSNEPTPAGLPQYVRFRHLKTAGIADSWSQLRHLIDSYGFPPGVRLSSNVRAWLVDEVTTWCNARPAEPKVISPRARRPRHQAEATA